MVLARIRAASLCPPLRHRRGKSSRCGGSVGTVSFSGAHLRRSMTWLHSCWSS